MGDKAKIQTIFWECGEFVQLVGRRALELDERWSSEPSAVISAPAVLEVLALGLALLQGLQRLRSAFVTPLRMVSYSWFLVARPHQTDWQRFLFAFSKWPARIS